jgi:hypothetical protein
VPPQIHLPIPDSPTCHRTYKPRLRSTTIKKIASATLFVAYWIYTDFAASPNRSYFVSKCRSRVPVH